MSTAANKKTAPKSKTPAKAAPEAEAKPQATATSRIGRPVWRKRWRARFSRRPM